MDEGYALVKEKMGEACRRAGRSPDSVRLLAVSKFHPVSAIRDLAELGQRDFGENYVQEALEKMAATENDLRWDLIGHLQTRKVGQIIGRFHLLHTVDSIKLAGHLERHLGQADLVQKILLEVNLGDEPQKAGISPGEVLSMGRYVIEQCPHLELRGLMCIPPVFDNGPQARPYFAKLRKLRDQMEKELAISLPELSMGMSGDFEEAILEGATIVRIGAMIFGPRPPRRV